VKAASDDTSASGDEIIEDLKGKVRANHLPTYGTCANKM
jgi:hypothetical protein